MRRLRLRWQCLTALAALLASAGNPRTVLAQGTDGTATLTGMVASEQGVQLPGANVFIAELQVSVGTSATGTYTIALPPVRVNGQTVQLRARSVGFEPQVKPVTLRPGTQTVHF